MKVNEFISRAKDEVGDIVINCNTDSRVVIARYTAAIAVNFTDWIGKTIPWVRHETARHALVDNLRCESIQDHVGMLLRFAALSNAQPNRDDFTHTYREVSLIRKLFTEPAISGLNGIALCAVLESTSEIFIPDLARRAEKCGCTDFTYTDIHGEADVKHSNAFIRALEAEQAMGYSDPEYLIEQTVKVAINLIASIYD